MNNALGLSRLEKGRRKALAILFFLLFILIFPFAILLCLPFYLFRFLLSKTSSLIRPDLGKPVHPRSAVIATCDPKQQPKWNLCVWITLEGNLNFPQFREFFLNNIILKKDTVKGSLVHPEFQQYFTTWCGFLFWKWEERFDVNEHMREFSTGGRVTGETELRAIIKDLTNRPFTEGKSPWEFLFIPNFKEEEDSEANKSVLIFRVHHGFCDGFTILWLLLKECNKVPLDKVARPLVLNKSLLKRVLDGCLFFLQAPYEFMNLIVKSSDVNDWHLPENELSRPFNTAFTRPIPLSLVKEVKNALGVSFTAVLMTAMTGGLRRTMKKMGKEIPRNITTAVAVPMPNHPERLRNHFIFSFMALPIGEAEPKRRLLKMEHNYQKLKGSLVPAFSFLLIPVFGALPYRMIEWFSFNRYSTLLTSNFPGPADAGDFIAGGGRNRVLDMNFSGGMGVGRVGLGFCMLSFAGGMRVISSVAKDILPTDESVEELNGYILEELETLKGMAWDNA